MIIEENDLQFDFSRAVSAKRFDDENHGLSQCMKAVDFIIEEPDRIVFIEVKDPQHPHARPHNVSEFIDDLTSEKLVNEKLTPKYRDSYLYELAMDNLGKPVYYYVLIALNTLTHAELLVQTEILRRQLPVEGPKDNPWRNNFAFGCVIMNLETWNTHLPQYPVSRISQQPSENTGN